MASYSYSPSPSPIASGSGSASQIEDRLLPQDTEPQQQSSSKPRHRVGSNSVRFGRVSPARCWLLGVLLLLTIAASWPTGTSAAPRRLSGRHLILPHRHHVHQRSAEHQALDQTRNITIVRPEPTSTLLCQYHRSAMSTKASLVGAQNVAEKTMEAITCLIGQWLDYYWKDGVTLSGAIDRYSLHNLNLTHPLHEETKKVRFDSDPERFIYENQAEVREASEELPKIADALMIVRHLMQSVTKGHSGYNCTFVHIIEKLSHNLYMAEAAMNSQPCSMSIYTYATSYPDHKFGVTLEAIKLLAVVQQKYKVLLEKQNGDEEEVN